MHLTDLAGWQIALLALPILPNLWCIWHAMRHDFPGEHERYLWMMLGTFLPVAGGLADIAFGLRRIIR
jgi:hypothetical protein